MNEERAVEIIRDLPEGDYRLEPTFIKLTPEGWRIEKSRSPLRNSRKTGQFTLNKNTLPGALVGIDSLFYDVAYPVSVVIYEGYEIKEPNMSRLRPMRHPGNCVAKLIREFYSDAARGGKLTDKRREAIRKWEKATERTGGTIANIKKLETALQRSIAVLDILGECIYEGTKKYKGRGPAIKIYQHNGHAWREVRFPRKKEVKVYESSPLYDMLYENSIWLLDDDGRQFVTQDGTLYRPRIEHESIREACKLLDEDFSEEVFRLPSGTEA